MRKIVLLLAVLTIVSCKKDPNVQVDAGAVKGNMYQNKEVGWTMEVPSGWDLVDLDNKKGQLLDAQSKIEQSTGENMDLDKVKHLISFKKDVFNVFQSAMEPFNLTNEKEWVDNNTIIKKMILKTFSDQNIKADSTATVIEKIGGKDFRKYEIKIYDETGKYILTQEVYNALINGYSFAANLNYNSDKNKKELDEVWRASTFK